MLRQSFEHEGEYEAESEDVTTKSWRPFLEGLMNSLT